MYTKKIGLLVTMCIMLLLFAGLSTLTQATTSIATPTPQPTVNRAPCEGEATRTPTTTATLLPTRNPRNPTPTATATTQNLPFTILLHYPPNCAVLHRNTLPEFEFDAPRGPFVSTVTIFNPDTDFHLQLVDYPNVDGTPVSLPDGTYYWSVSATRMSGAGGESETWEFQINTSCNCTDTPTPTATP